MNSRCAGIAWEHHATTDAMGVRMFYAEYVLKGDTGQAVKTYRNSLELIPGNSNAVEMLEKLEQVESQRPSECRAGTQSLAFTIARISSI